MKIERRESGSAAEAEKILRALPEWFGIEESTQAYIAFADDHVTFIARNEDENPIGFLSIEQHFPHAAEIHVMGVLPDYHRQGVGRTLTEATEDYLREQGVQFLQVKTLSSDHPDERYARTRQFYLSMHFMPLEIFPTLWGERIPCLQLIKSL
jgi:GNAT superfamily N-acetyltransferase